MRILASQLVWPWCVLPACLPVLPHHPTPLRPTKPPLLKKKNNTPRQPTNQNWRAAVVVVDFRGDINQAFDFTAPAISSFSFSGVDDVPESPQPSPPQSSFTPTNTQPRQTSSQPRRTGSPSPKRIVHGSSSSPSSRLPSNTSPSVTSSRRYVLTDNMKLIVMMMMMTTP